VQSTREEPNNRQGRHRPDRRGPDGLRLAATDMAWSAGDGPEAHGTAEAILTAVNGRRAALPDVDGPGVQLLGSRQRRHMSSNRLGEEV
jgi:hypothetical protein